MTFTDVLVAWYMAGVAWCDMWTQMWTPYCYECRQERKAKS